MGSLRTFLALGVVLLAANVASAVITVVTDITATPQDGVRAQAIIKDATGFADRALGGGTVTAVAIKEIHAAIFIIDGEINNGLSVQKRQLTAQQAYGLGLPFGYENPPTTDPLGPWFGLIWPYRDQYDYFPDLGDPLGDDVGTPVQPTGNVYGFLDIDGIARGGPTDPEPAGGSPNLLLRGITGNGLTGPATYFSINIDPLFGPPDRFVTIQVLSTTARVVVQNQAGAFSEIVVPVAPFTTQIQLPEPAGIACVIALLAASARRRRS